MAIDSKLKRISAVGARRLPWMRRFAPSPESSVDQADRQHVAFLYRGILAGAPALNATLQALEYTCTTRTFDYTAPQRTFDYQTPAPR